MLRSSVWISGSAGAVNSSRKVSRDALFGGGVGVVGMRFVGRDARLLAEEVPIDGVDIDAGSAGPENAPDRSVQVGVAAEDAQENAVVRIEFVVAERARLDVGIAERQLGHADAVVVLECEVKGAHPHWIGEDFAHVRACPDGVAL